MTTHCDIGISVTMAAYTGEKPTIEYLCDDYSDGGGSLRRADCYYDWTLPAAVDCPKCRQVLEVWNSLSTGSGQIKDLPKARKITSAKFSAMPQPPNKQNVADRL